MPVARGVKRRAVVKAVFFSLIGYFLTPAGVILIGALDSSLVFFLPLGVDFVAIIMAARKPELFWLYALLATAGSMVGVAATFWIGRKAGEKGLARFVKRSRLERIQRQVNGTAVYGVAALALIPPPFPFTAFVLTSGALKVEAWHFFGLLAVARLLRFGVETALAAHYGRGILAWMQSRTFTVIVGVLIVVAVVGTAVSAVALIRGTRRRNQVL
jgi:membrane protein YqaA with SNARE-associated domain